ncbi:Tyr recombinase domain-containing protein [Pararobbsia alpina]|uniref:tyrosine-type recombinase/integrase n=1 Tax=Pararobbsia alpina TaxID=621374 RepID=UPI0039A4DECE
MKASARQERLRIAALIRNFPLLAEKTLAQVRTPDLADWRDARLQGFIGPDGEPVRPVSGSSVVRDAVWLGNAFSVARLEWHWMQNNPWEGFRQSMAAPPRDRRVDPWKQVRPLCRRLGYVTGAVPTTKQQEVALAFLVALRTGMRAGELLQLGGGMLGIVQRVATVKHKTQHLTGRPRKVPLTRHAIRLLRPVAYKESCFTLTSASLDALFRKCRDQLVITGLHFHDSRAEALTRLSRKVNVMTLAKISVHKDIGLLQNTYYRETAAQIAARLSACGGRVPLAYDRVHRGVQSVRSPEYKDRLSVYQPVLGCSWPILLGKASAQSALLALPPSDTA